MKFLLSSYIMSFLGLVLPRISTLLAYILASKNLGAEEFGYYAYIQSTMVTAGLISALGLSQVVMSLFAKTTERNDTTSRAEVLSLLRFISGFSIVATLGAIAILLALTPKGGYVLAATALSLTSIPLITREALFSAGLIGLKDLRSVAVNGSLVTLFTIVVTAILTYAFGLVGGLFSLFLSYLFSTLLAELKLRKRFNLSSPDSRADAEKLSFNIRLHVRITAPSMLAYTAVALTFWGSQTLVAASENSYISITILAVARQWLQAIQMVPGSLSRVFLPAMAEVGCRQKQFSVLRKNLAINTAATLLVLLTLLVFSGEILSLYEIRGSTEQFIFSVFLISGAVAAVTDPIGQYLVAARKIWISAAINLTWAILFWIIFSTSGEFSAASNSEALLVSYGIIFLLLIAVFFTTERRSANGKE